MGRAWNSTRDSSRKVDLVLNVAQIVLVMLAGRVRAHPVGEPHQHN